MEWPKVGRRFAAAVGLIAGLVGSVGAAVRADIAAAWLFAGGGWLLALVEASVIWENRRAAAPGPPDTGDRQERNRLAEECERQAEAIYVWAGCDRLGNPPKPGTPGHLAILLNNLHLSPAEFDREHGATVRSLARRLEPFGIVDPHDRALLARTDAWMEVAARLRGLAAALWT